MRRMNVNENGERIYKHVVIKVFTPDGSRCSKQNFRAPRGTGVTQSDIDDGLRNVAEQVRQQYPEYKYKLVRLPEQQYNFVCIGKQSNLICLTN